MRQPSHETWKRAGSVGSLVHVFETLTKWGLEAMLEQGGSLSEVLCPGGA